MKMKNWLFSWNFKKNLRNCWVLLGSNGFLLCSAGFLWTAGFYLGSDGSLVSVFYNLFMWIIFCLFSFKKKRIARWNSSLLVLGVQGILLYIEAKSFLVYFTDFKLCMKSNICKRKKTKIKTVIYIVNQTVIVR